MQDQHNTSDGESKDLLNTGGIKWHLWFEGLDIFLTHIKWFTKGRSNCFKLTWALHVRLLVCSLYSRHDNEISYLTEVSFQLNQVPQDISLFGKVLLNIFSRGFFIRKKKERTFLGMWFLFTVMKTNKIFLNYKMRY